MKRAAGLIILFILLMGCAQAEEKRTEAWIMCQLNSEVCVRASPNKHAEEVARAYPGQRVELSGKKQGRWYHCLIPCEAGEGWIRGDFLSDFEPEIYPEGRTFRTTHGKVYARYSIRGNKRATLKKGAKVTVYMLADEWAVTSKGYIMTEFLEEAGPDGT